DLGVSSPQLDNAARGFSFQQEGPLDMRMNNTTGVSAARWLNEASEGEIADVLRKYGEERYARRIARAILARRREKPLRTTTELAELVAGSVPVREKHKHPATRTFQAVRIQVNRELEELRLGLQQALEVLAPGGRLVVISFHSLEDRIVKRFMRDHARGEVLPKGVPVRKAELVEGSLRLLGKAVRAGEDEVRNNPRARSAIMRVAEKRA
ncbi:MAG TPA: 16S rRNA (cytosine(1402)-N(4))-methyltransferase RsmH, partial [Chromatiaceae bacterium]|nr:16S rRNA (cytosine(1402)-N(4))-methyltransferase RsmH [Chromatiaceae bacterium]